MSIDWETRKQKVLDQFQDLIAEDRRKVELPPKQCKTCPMMSHECRWSDEVSGWVCPECGDWSLRTTVTDLRRQLQVDRRKTDG